jgi:hypothetical protein
MVKDADGQRLRRRPNVGTVGAGYISGSPRSWPSAYADGLFYADGNALGIAIFHFTILIL